MYSCTLYAHCMHPSMCTVHCRLADLQKQHTAEVAKLQRSLEEEREGRTAAQHSLSELRGEVAIGIDDTSLNGSAGLGGEESNRLESFSKPLIEEVNY